jgi:hypothetical protein
MSPAAPTEFLKVLGQSFPEDLSSPSSILYLMPTMAPADIVHVLPPQQPALYNGQERGRATPPGLVFFLQDGRAISRVPISNVIACSLFHVRTPCLRCSEACAATLTLGRFLCYGFKRASGSKQWKKTESLPLYFPIHPYPGLKMACELYSVCAKLSWAANVPRKPLSRMLFC